MQVGDGGVLLRWWTAASGSALPATAGRARETELTCMMDSPVPDVLFLAHCFIHFRLVISGYSYLFSQKKKR